MACEMEIASSGEVSGYKFYPAVIRSHARLTYTEAWEKLSNKTAKEHLAVLYDVFKVLLEQRERPDFALLQTILLRSLKQAVYSPNNAGHFGLAFDAYVHFPSPIRRYPDLLVHRAIKAILARKRYDGVDWEALGRHCSETERRADDASRDVENWLKCYYMRDHVGGTFSGTITGVAPFGLFVTLDDYFVDGLVHISELGRDYFQYDDARHMLLGDRTGMRYRLADRMTVKLVRVDIEQRKMDLVPA